ncbi:hypothetical protein PROVRUST_04689 [Providencia rustigianii DSM 4541]|uniref:Uncharacterized protein n=1 Tax=Providencia rustigianii DSM 4541 TaxID=500637 RepID=D1NXQ5_9GAMM|nr:hypothetical protein PROVRUST_04689 [Providencia rustigianii DSM 4541]
METSLKPQQAIRKVSGSFDLPIFFSLICGNAEKFIGFLLVLLQ